MRVECEMGSVHVGRWEGHTWTSEMVIKLKPERSDDAYGMGEKELEREEHQVSLTFKAPETVSFCFQAQL